MQGTLVMLEVKPTFISWFLLYKIHTKKTPALFLIVKAKDLLFGRWIK